MKDKASVTYMVSEVGKRIEVSEGDALAWENTLFLQVWDSYVNAHKVCIYLKDEIPYEEVMLSQKELDDFKYFMQKALDSESVSVVKCGNISITVAHQGDKYGIAVKNRKWMLSEESVPLLSKFCS